VFRRVDLAGTPVVAARIENVVSEQRRTVLQSPEHGGARVETVEHILSALAGAGVTDAVVDVEGPEIPIGDGSALALIRAIRTAGTVARAGSALSPLRITRPLTFAERGGQIDVLPLESGRAEGCEYVYRLDYGAGSPVARQEASFFLPTTDGTGEYDHEIAPARTFSTVDEAQHFRRLGLFSAFTPRDLLVIGPDGPVDNSLRFANEPARHKVLDLIGDLALCGRPIVGRVIAARSGHALSHEVARALVSLP
jgi:UDP-3-O-acyl-N-acetylglucosamine deacetylase